MAFRTTMRMTDGGTLSAREQLLLLAWFSPAFPIGGFAFSHGLEWAQEIGTTHDRASLENWIGDLLQHGSGRADAILCAATYRAQAAGARHDLQYAIDLGAALQPSSERYLEANVQGTAFLNMVEAAYPLESGKILHSDLDLTRITLPVAAGISGAAHGIALSALLTAYLSGFIANLVSAAVRLGIVGQTDGQRIIAGLQPAIAALAQDAQALTLDDLGAATLRSDLFSLQHETQYSRLFRS